MGTVSPPDSVPRTPGSSPTKQSRDWLMISGITAAVLGAVLLIPNPFVAVPLSIVAIVLALVHPTAEGNTKSVVRATWIIGTMTLVAAAVLAFFLMAGSDGPA
ncbi:MAG: hypothetical protein ACTH1D_03735 [Mycobacteriaceae bacterium]|uniref:hypothetical protein n=1 Tax=Corynebacterium sp. TaxID=1720 RepID=UPI003F9AD7B9